MPVKEEIQQKAGERVSSKEATEENTNVTWQIDESQMYAQRRRLTHSLAITARKDLALKKKKFPPRQSTGVSGAAKSVLMVRYSRPLCSCMRHPSWRQDRGPHPGFAHLSICAFKFSNPSGLRL